MGFKIKIFFIIICLLLAFPVCSASDDADLNQTLAAADSQYNDNLLSEDNDYIHIYVNASASSPGNGTEEAPYQNLSSVNNIFENKTILHIANGYYNYYDSDINPMLIFTDVKFIGESVENTIIDFCGDGICAFTEWDSNIYLENIKLFNTSLNLINYYGQEVYGGKIEGVNVTFENSKSSVLYNPYYVGGAISCFGELKLTNCVFINNSAELGGAIFVLLGGEIANCTFINNVAGVDGGAIFAAFNDVKISDTVFTNNTALKSGGAIYSVSGLSIIQSNFTDNFALSYGGAITSVENPYLYLNYVNFINNSAVSSAGAIYSMFSENYFYNSAFINCSSLIGGAICDLYSFSVFSSLNFTSNNATKGGAVYKMYNDTLIINSIFSSNQACEGGALYIDDVNSANLTNLHFNKNTADYGGDIYYLGNITNINLTNVDSPDLFNISFLNIIQRANDYDLFEIDDTPVVFDSRYDMRDYGYLTEVKSQDDDNDGNCWAFATIAALESCILKANGTSYDFSEQNLKNLMAMFSDYGNSNFKTNIGGNSLMSIGYFGSWLGPIYDEDDSYSSNPLSFLYDPVTHIQNIIFISRPSFTDNDNIKEAIMKYGGVVATMFYWWEFLNDDGVSYYSEIDNDCNHQVVIVGWDDNYPKEKFKTTPPGNGAFIVRNSWGPDWGENGYFYVSYYDLRFANVKSPYDSLFTFVLNDTNHYDKNYQHEIQETISMDIGINPFYMENSFKAESDELISAVSTYFNDYSYYGISIFVNGNLKHFQEGNVAGGYFTIPLTKYVPIKQGDTFDIMVEIFSFNQPSPTIFLFDYAQNSRIAQTGVSFYSLNGETWFDVGEEGFVFPIKGFTKYGKLNTTLEVTGLDSDWTINKNFTIVAMVKDQFGDYINEDCVTFLIDGIEYSVDLSNHTANKNVLFNQAGEHNITVLFNPDYYYYPSIVSQLITIDPVNTVLSLSLTNDTLFVNDSLSVRAVVNASQGKVNFYINGLLNDSVDVNDDGVAVLVLDNLSYGSYDLTAIYTDEMGTYLNSSNKTTFQVIYPIRIVTENLTKYYNESDRFSARIFGNDGKILSGKKVKFTIDNIAYENITDSKGYAYLDIRLQPGNYTVKTSYEDHEVSNMIKIFATLFDKDMQILPLDIYEGENEIIEVVLPKDATGNLSITVNKKKYIATINKGTANINIPDLKYGNYSVDVIYYGDSHYNSVKGKTSFTVEKAQINIIAPDITIYYGSNETFVVALLNHDHPIANAKVKITLDNVEYNKLTNSEGITAIDLALKSGVYNVITEYGDYKSYSTVTVNTTIISNDLNCDFINFYYNATFLDSNGNPLAKGSKVSFIFNGIASHTFTKVTNDKGVAYLTKDDLYSIGDVGYYNVTIINSVTNELTYNVINISKTATNISLDIVQNDETVILLAKINPNPMSDGKIKFMIGGKEYVSDIHDGESELSVSDLYSGTYVVNASYGGNNYFMSGISENIPLVLSYITIYAPDVTKYYGGSERLVVTLKDKDRPISNAILNITINDVLYQRPTNDEGIVSMGINLNSGVYISTIEYNKTKAQSLVSVKETVLSNDFSKIFRNDTQYYTTFIDSQGNLLKNMDVTFNINGVFYTRSTNEKGVARLNINLNPGVYILTAYNPLSGEQHANTITVLSSIVENNDLTKFFKNESQFSFRLLDNKGSPVGAGVNAILNINGVLYTRSTNASGYVNMNINLNPGTYIITIEYNGLKESNTIKVLPILKANNLDMKYLDGSKFEATLLDGKGNPFANQYITFNINGVFYQRPTDDNGIARLNIRLMAGVYIISSMYENGAVISNKITISN